MAWYLQARSAKKAPLGFAERLSRYVRDVLGEPPEFQLILEIIAELEKEINMLQCEHRSR